MGCNEELVYDVEVENAPVLSSFSPASGRQGDLITIEGENLQSIDSVTIGGGSATIKYRINSTSMVVMVNSESKSGAIVLANGAGSAQSASDFTVLYPAPVIATFPAKAKAYDKIVIEGSNMDVITAVNFDTIQAVITTQQEELIEVLVPYFLNPDVDIIFTYPTETAEATVVSDSKFELDIVPPTIVNFPTEAADSTEIEITGDDLYVIDKVMFGDVEGMILFQEDTIMTVLVPEYPVTTTVPLTVYYRGNEVAVTDAFQVQVATLAYWSDMTIYSATKDGVPATDSTFFEATFGNMYGPCDWDEKKDKIHFFIGSMGGGIVLIGQDPNGTFVGGYECNGTALNAEKSPNNVRFKVLNASDSDEADLINKVKTQTLEELNSALLNELGVGDATSAFLMPGTFAEGDVILFQQYDAADAVVEYTGALEVVKLTATASEASLNFNAYFGAY